MRIVALALLVLAVGCGEVNPNKYLFVRDNQSEALDVLVQEAEYHYDQGEFEDAKEKAEKAFNLNNDNEEVRILLGYIYLSLGGIDTFQLSEALINQGDSGTSLALAEKDAANTLSGLGGITSITEADYANMGTVQNSDRTEFSDLPVIYPSSAEDARSKVTSLNYINLAIKMACPSVDASVKIENDPRHTEDACPASKYSVQLPGKAHFLWAFGHLADALSFNQVIQYTTTDQGKANLALRGEAAGNLADSSLSDYSEVMSQLSTDITNIMQTDDNGSQLNAVYNGLEATNLAFAQLSGVPDSLTKGISEALDSIKQGATDSGKSENEVLKGQLNEGVTNELSSKIEQAAQDQPEEFASNKTELCNTFDTIAEGQGSRPSACN